MGWRPVHPIALVMSLWSTDEYGDLIEMGIIDPVKVVKCALTNAAGVAGTLLTTEVAICDTPEDEAPQLSRTPKPHRCGGWR